MSIATDVRQGFDTPHPVKTGVIFFPPSPNNSKAKNPTHEISSPATAPAVEAARHAGTAYKIIKTPDSPVSRGKKEEYNFYCADADTQDYVAQFLSVRGLIKNYQSKDSNTVAAPTKKPTPLDTRRPSMIDQSKDSNTVAAPTKKPTPLDTRRPSMIERSDKENNGPSSGPHRSMIWNNSPRTLDKALTELKEKLLTISTVEPETGAPS